MSKKDNKEELYDLLDSFQEDDTMERKMNEFARQKENISRTQKIKEEKDDSDDFIRIKAKPEGRIPRLEEDEFYEELSETKTSFPDPTNVEQEEEGSKTVVFDKNKIEEEASSTDETVMIDDQEIQSLIDENKGPKLHVDKEHPQTKTVRRKKKPKNDNGKKVGAVVVGILAVVLVVGIFFGIFKLVQNGLEDHNKLSKEDQEKIFEQINDYLDDEYFDDLSDLRRFESLYEKLPRDMQKEIDDRIFEITSGRASDFKELLSQVKKKHREKEDKDDQDKKDQIKEAEKKAKISELQSKIQELNNKAGNLEDEITSKKKAYDDAVAEYNAARSDYSSIENELNNLKGIQGQIQGLTGRDLESLTDQDKATLESLRSQYGSDAQISQDISNLQGKLSEANENIGAKQKAMNDAKASYDRGADKQSQYDDIQEQINQLENELNSLR